MAFDVRKLQLDALTKEFVADRRAGDAVESHAP
jgi:hypothetical protein